MAHGNAYVEIDFDENTKKFKCLSDGLGEYITDLKEGDVFSLVQQGVAITGTIKYSATCKPYGYYFISDTDQLTVELNDGMVGYIQRNLENGSQYLGVEKETLNKF